MYKKALEMTAKAPALHAELQKQFAQQQLAMQARAPARWVLRCCTLPAQRFSVLCVLCDARGNANADWAVQEAAAVCQGLSPRAIKVSHG